jgi:hypothetical protein
LEKKGWRNKVSGYFKEKFSKKGDNVQKSTVPIVYSGYQTDENGNIVNNTNPE